MRGAGRFPRFLSPNDALASACAGIDACLQRPGRVSGRGPLVIGCNSLTD